MWAALARWRWHSVSVRLRRPCRALLSRIHPALPVLRRRPVPRLQRRGGRQLGRVGPAPRVARPHHRHPRPRAALVHRRAHPRTVQLDLPTSPRVQADRHHSPGCTLPVREVEQAAREVPRNQDRLEPPARRRSRFRTPDGAGRTPVGRCPPPPVNPLLPVGRVDALLAAQLSWWMLSRLWPSTIRCPRPPLRRHRQVPCRDWVRDCCRGSAAGRRVGQTARGRPP